jgi:FAD:protein FMN transferase
MRFTGIAMTIPYCVQIGASLSEKQICTIEGVILETFSEINQIYNNWNPESEISKLNQAPAYEKICLSEKLAAFLQFTDQIVAQTEGRFDPTVEPLQQLWKSSLKEGSCPPKDALIEIQEAVGWAKIHLENGFFWKEHPLTAIDLGGIAKGYAVDLLTERLLAHGYTSIYVEWGGEIRTAGYHPDQRPWKIAIEGVLTPLVLTDLAIATSGSYIQNWQVNGISYTHIIDPKTQEPIQNALISSASVIAPTCREADAIATALMLFPSKEAAKTWAKARGYQVFIW